MRSFSREEQDFIIRVESLWTLGKLADFFKCDWKEVYNCYSNLIKSKDYKQRAEEVRQKVSLTILGKGCNSPWKDYTDIKIGGEESEESNDN